MEIFDIQRYKVDNELKVTFEFLEDILEVERNTCKALFSGVITEAEPAVQYGELGGLKQLHEASWPHSVVSADLSYNQPLNQLDCIIIHLKLLEMELAERPSEKDFEVNLLEIDINLKTFKGALKDRKTGQLLQELTLIRSDSLVERKRQLPSQKCIGSALNINKARKNKFDIVKGAFGQKWCFKNNNRSTPSIKEVVTGLNRYYREVVL